MCEIGPTSPYAREMALRRQHLERMQSEWPFLGSFGVHRSCLGWYGFYSFRDGLSPREKWWVHFGGTELFDRLEAIRSLEVPCSLPQRRAEPWRSNRKV